MTASFSTVIQGLPPRRGPTGAPTRLLAASLSARLAAGLSAGLALAAAGAWGLPEDADQPIEIRARQAEYDQRAATVTYRGEVRVEQGSMRVTADEMVVHYEDQKVVRITAEGRPATYRQLLEEPQGEVEADAAIIVYHTQQEQVDLQGDATLSQGGNIITGELIHYDIVGGRAQAEAGDEGPVTVTVQPARRTDSGPTDSDGPEQQ